MPTLLKGHRIYSRTQKHHDQEGFTGIFIFLTCFSIRRGEAVQKNKIRTVIIQHADLIALPEMVLV